MNRFLVECSRVFPVGRFLGDRVSLQELLNSLISFFGTSTSHRLAVIEPVQRFDVNEETGFLPDQPLPRLSGSYLIWEQGLALAPGQLSLGEDDSDEAVAKRLQGDAWRKQIDSWPILDTKELEDDDPSLKRAHLVLAWLVHFYVHSIPTEEDLAEPVRIPASLAVPLVAVSNALGTAPVLTYADTVMWNWDVIHPDRPVTHENIRFQNLFSGTEDERNFYIMSIQVEFRGVELLRIIEEFRQLSNFSSMATIAKVTRLLVRLQWMIEDLAGILQSVRPLCDPHVFYWDVRPWFEGADAKGPYSTGWIYDGVPDSHLLDLSGPSAGQSSVMHALDIFLDVDHELRQNRSPAPSAENRKADVGFMHRMRRYMVRSHREFLQDLASSKSIRELAATIPALREPYNNAVQALKNLRDQHIRVATLYVVSMSKTIPGRSSGCPVSAAMEKLQVARASGAGPIRGSGGAALSQLLKAGRDATRRAML